MDLVLSAGCADNAPDTQSPRAGDSRLSVALIAANGERRREIAEAIRPTDARVDREFTEYPAGDALAQLIQSDSDVIMIDLDGGVEAGVDLITAICERNLSVTVMACSSRYEADVVVRCMHAGAREFLAEPLVPASVEEALLRVSSRRKAVPSEARAGKILVFQGAKGGVGATTLAINFAAALSNEKAGSVVLVDFHPQLGEIALGLGIASRFSLTDAMENAPRLDRDLLSTLLMKHESGLMVLASSDVYGPQRFRAHDSEQLLRVLREEFAFVVVDAGPCSGSSSEVLFEMADTVYLVVEINLPALRNARRLISWFSGRQIAQHVEVILNRFNSREVELDEESATKALSRPVDWKIPNDYLTVRGAQNLGTPLVLRDSAVSHAVRRMAKHACGRFVPGPHENAPGALKGDKWKFWTSKNARPPSMAHS